MQLTFPYRRTSTLPRRTFRVDVTTVGDQGERPVAYDVTAPDPDRAEYIVRQTLDRTDSVWSFRLDLVREVSFDYDRRVVVTVPSWFQYAIPEVMHR